MIFLSELCRYDFQKLPIDHQINLMRTHQMMNLIRSKYGKPMVVTSGYRSIEDHVRIYQDRKLGNPPMGSLHLSGLAVDIADPKGDLKSWVMDHLDFFKSIPVCFEDFSVTSNWVHFQFLYPLSQKTFFIP